MRRILILTAAAVVLLLIVAQLALPALAENAIEDRLTERGGTAQVDLEAFPVARLLFKDGDSLEVRASGIQTPLGGIGSLEDLDGFDEVGIEVTRSTAGPFRISLMTLERREGARNYSVRIQATATGADLSAYAGSRIGGGLGGFLGGLAGGAMPGSDVEIPIDLAAVLRSDDGRARAVSIDGSVAGLPAGPLAEALATALAGRF